LPGLPLCAMAVVEVAGTRPRHRQRRAARRAGDVRSRADEDRFIAVHTDAGYELQGRRSGRGQLRRAQDVDVLAVGCRGSQNLTVPGVTAAPLAVTVAVRVTTDPVATVVTGLPPDVTPSEVEVTAPVAHAAVAPPAAIIANIAIPATSRRLQGIDTERRGASCIVGSSYFHSAPCALARYRGGPSGSRGQARSNTANLEQIQPDSRKAGDQSIEFPFGRILLLR
jgi:hypothetical protein